MYSSKVFAWLAAGAIGLGSSAALAQYEPEDEDAPGIQQQETLQDHDEAIHEEPDVQEPLAVEEQAEAQQLRDQITQTLQQSYQQHGLDEQQARQQAEQLAGEVEQYSRDVQQQIQQTLQEHAQLDQQQAQQEAERISQEIAQQLTEVGVQVPAEVEDEAIQQQQQQMIEDEAQQQSIQGTVIDAASFLIHGEQAIQDQQQQEQQQQLGQQQAFVLVTEQGEAYLIVERPADDMEPGFQPPLEEPMQDPAEFEQEQFEQEQDVPERTGIRSPVRDRLAPRADHGTRQGIAQREQERWERHPGEWREEDPQVQEELLLDEPEEVDPAAVRESRVYDQLDIGQQVTLTGEVHERGGLRGIVIDEYGIEHNGLEDPLEAPDEQVDEPDMEMEEDLNDDNNDEDDD